MGTDTANFRPVSLTDNPKFLKASSEKEEVRTHYETLGKIRQ